MPFIQPPFWSRDLNAYGGRWPQHVSVSLVTPPAGEPLSIQEMRSQVRLGDDGSQDADLLLWGTAARMDTEAYTGCAWMQQGVDVRFAHFPFDRSPIVIPIRPLVSVSGIDYLDASGALQTLDPTTYVVDAPKPVAGIPECGRVMLAFGTFYWPFPPAMRVINGVTIHCVVGYGTAAQVPPTPKVAMKLLLGTWWLNREGGEIIRGSADILPYGIDRVLDPFKLEVLA